MEKENSGNPYDSYQEKKLISFIDGLPRRKDLRQENNEYAQREKYWEGWVGHLRESLEMGKMKKDNFDKVIGNLIAFKEFSATYDALTGLPNKRNFNKNLKIEIAKAKREKSNLSLLVIDVDNMKGFNDEDKSHFIGDRAIKNTAKTLVNATRENDFVARWAGDEFAVILPHTEEKMAFMISQRILEKIKEVPIFSPSGRRLAISIGIKQWQGEDNKDFFNKADKALLNEAKLSPEKIAISR